MPGPTFMAHEVRGASGNALARIVRGGTFSELLGVDGITEAKETVATPLASFQVRSLMKRWRGLIYASGSTRVNVLDPITGLWSVSRAFTAVIRLAASCSDMIVVDTTIGGFLIQLATNNPNFLEFHRFDGTSWVSDITANVVGGFSSRAFYHKGIVYAVNGGTGGASTRVSTYNPVTRAVTSTLVSPAPVNVDSILFSVDDRIFFYTPASGLAAAGVIFEFQFGTWIDTGLVLPDIQVASGGQVAGFRLGNDVFIFAGDGNTDALRCLKLNVATPGGALVFAEITVPIPAVLQAGSTIGTPEQYKVHGILDTSSVPGSETGYLYFLPDETLTAIPTLFRWNGEAALMTVAASPQLTGESGVPTLFYGGGESFNGLGTVASKLVSTTPEGSAQGPNGVTLSFSAWGDMLVVPHGAITGTITIGDVATQVGSGATGIVERTSPNETWLRNATGVWTDTQLFNTVGGPGGSATQNAVATGGLSDKTVVPRFHVGPGQTGLGVAISGTCTIVPGSVTGGGTPAAVESGGSIINVTADGRTFSFEWDFFADGLVDGSFDNVELSIARP